MAEITSGISVATLEQLGDFLGSTELGGISSLRRSNDGNYHLTVADLVGSEIRQTSFTLDPRGRVISSGSECPVRQDGLIHQLPGLSAGLPFSPQEVIQAIINSRGLSQESAPLNAPGLAFDRAIMANRGTFEFELVERADVPARLENGFHMVTTDTGSIEHFKAHRSEIAPLLNAMQFANEDIESIDSECGGFNGDVDDYREDSFASSREFGEAQGRFERAERALRTLAPYLADFLR